MQWRVTLPAGSPSCSYTIGLRRADGVDEVFGAGMLPLTAQEPPLPPPVSSGPPPSPRPATDIGNGMPGVFLAAGDRQVVAHGCAWCLQISPARGSLGGGVRGFAG